MKLLSILVCLLGFIATFLATVGYFWDAKVGLQVIFSGMFMITSSIFLCSMFIIIAIYKNKQ